MSPCKEFGLPVMKATLSTSSSSNHELLVIGITSTQHLKETMSTHLLQGFGFWSSLFTLDVLLLFSPLCLFRMSAGMVMGMNNVSRLIQNMLKNS